MASHFSPGQTFGSNQPVPRTTTRRSSYASVVSGTPATAPTSNTNQQSPRSGFLSQFMPAGSTTSDSSRPPRYSQNSFPGADSTHARQSTHSNHWEGTHLPQYSHTFGETLGMPTVAQYTSQDFFVPSYLRGSRHVERLEEKYKARLSAQRDGRNSKSSGNGTLSTSSSGINLHKMVPSHRGMTHEIIERPYSRPEDKLSPLPSRWSSNDKHSALEMSRDGLEIKFNGVPKTTDDAASVRADAGMPRECGIYYFEITVLSKGKDSQVGVGYSAAKVPLNRLPGWEPESWAYHGDDGYSFCQTPSGKNFGSKFGFSDVIGCGINFRTGNCFYTKNGLHIGIAFKELDTSITFYPSVGMKKPGEQIRANFGQSPFVFDIDGMVAKEKELALAEILSTDSTSLRTSQTESSHIHSLILQYLAHDGYVSTAKALTSELQAQKALLNPQISSSTSEDLEYKEDQDAINRQKIRAAVLEGDIDKALKLTKAYYPGVLQENGDVYFKLRCRRFVELIIRSDEIQRGDSNDNPEKHHPDSGQSKRVAMNGHSSSGPGDSAIDDRPTTAHSTSSVEGAMDLDSTHADSDSGNEDDDENVEMSDLSIKQSDLFVQTLQYGQDLQAEFKDDPRREVKQALEDTFALIAYPNARESSLAPLLDVEGRVGVAEELNSAILVSLGKSSNAILEKLCQESEVLCRDLEGRQGERTSFINVRKDFMSPS